MHHFYRQLFCRRPFKGSFWKHIFSTGQKQLHLSKSRKFAHYYSPNIHHRPLLIISRGEWYKPPDSSQRLNFQLLTRFNIKNKINLCTLTILHKFWPSSPHSTHYYIFFSVSFSCLSQSTTVALLFYLIFLLVSSVPIMSIFVPLYVLYL